MKKVTWGNYNTFEYKYITCVITRLRFIIRILRSLHISLQCYGIANWSKIQSHKWIFQYINHHANVLELELSLFLVLNDASEGSLLESLMFKRLFANENLARISRNMSHTSMEAASSSNKNKNTFNHFFLSRKWGCNYEKKLQGK